MPKPPISEKPALTERERLKMSQEQRDTAPKQSLKKVVKATPADLKSALEALHGKEVIHRDMKPRSIKVTPEGKVKVLDFGIAKAPERDYIRWDSVCAALAEDVLLDETPPGSPDDVDRLRKRIAQITQQHADAKRESDHNLVAEIALRKWQERIPQERQENDNQGKPPNEILPSRKT